MESPTLWNGQMEIPHSKGISHALESEWTDGETETNWRFSHTLDEEAQLSGMDRWKSLTAKESPIL